MKKRVILVTDGDSCARKAVEAAATNIGGRCISRSAGNPTLLSGKEIIEYIKEAKYDPVVVMVDDRGNTHKGSGEQALDYILSSNEIEVMGVIAVASNTSQVKGVKVDFSIDRDGKIIHSAVDKNGLGKKGKVIKGDTVDVLNDLNPPIVIGIGDPGKMEGYDDYYDGAPVITRAMEEIVRNYDNRNRG